MVCLRRVVGAIVNHLVIGNDDIVLKMLTLLGMMLYIVPYCLHTNVKKSCENNKKSRLTGISRTVGLCEYGYSDLSGLAAKANVNVCVVSLRVRM